MANREITWNELLHGSSTRWAWHPRLKLHIIRNASALAS